MQRVTGGLQKAGLEGQADTECNRRLEGQAGTVWNLHACIHSWLSTTLKVKKLLLACERRYFPVTILQQPVVPTVSASLFLSPAVFFMKKRKGHRDSKTNILQNKKALQHLQSYDANNNDWWRSHQCRQPNTKEAVDETVWWKGGTATSWRQPFRPYIIMLCQPIWMCQKGVCVGCYIPCYKWSLHSRRSYLVTTKHWSLRYAIRACKKC